MNSIESNFVSYQTALDMKLIGFDEPCMAIYYSKDKSFSWHHHKDHTNDEPALDSGEFNISAPIYSAAFRWFRDKHGLHILIDAGVLGYYGHLKINPIGTLSSQTKQEWINTENYPFKTYEEAELACLDKLIKIIKNK